MTVPNNYIQFSLGIILWCRNLLGTTLPLANTYDFPTGTSLPLYMKDFRKAFNLAKEASKCTQVPEMRAESNYIMGRVHHAQGRYSDAHFYYNEVVYLEDRMLSIVNPI